MENTVSSTVHSQSDAAVSPVLRQRIDRHLLTCSAMTLGATVALAAGAQGDIITSPANVAVPVAFGTGTPRVYIDFDTMTIGTTAVAGYDLSLLDIVVPATSSSFGYHRLFAIGSKTTTGPVLDAATASQVGEAANFAAGVSITNASPFHQYGALAQHFYSTGGRTYNYGNFTATGTSYLGFDFTDKNGQVDKGWLEVNFNADNFASNTSSLTVLGFGYDNTGADIATGQTVVATPEPGSMAIGCLAAGAAGLGLWRRRRTAKATVADAQP